MNYALVTGGSRGIGRAIALRLAKDGWKILVNYCRNSEAAEETLRMIEAEGGQGEILKMDVSNGEEVKAVMDQWYETHSEDKIDVLINNAGVRKDGLMVWMEDEDWHRVVDTTLDGFYHVTRRVVERMVRQRGGRIINMSSLSGVTGIAGQVNYSAAKAGLIGATKALSKELAGRKITVNAIAPGFIRTDMTSDLDEEELKKQIPARRLGEAEEVAALVGFLCSKEAAYITGQVIEIAGGMG